MRNVPLHFGQNSRKFSKTVSLRICVRVFPPQAGHRIHRAASILRPPLLRLAAGFHQQHHRLKLRGEHPPQLLLRKPAHPRSAQRTEHIVKADGAAVFAHEEQLIELPSASPSSRAVSASMPLRETMSSAATISSLVNLGFGGIRSLLLLKSHVLNRLFCNERFILYGFSHAVKRKIPYAEKTQKKSRKALSYKAFRLSGFLICSCRGSASRRRN